MVSRPIPSDYAESVASKKTSSLELGNPVALVKHKVDNLLPLSRAKAEDLISHSSRGLTRNSGR